MKPRTTVQITPAHVAEYLVRGVFARGGLRGQDDSNPLYEDAANGAELMLHAARRIAEQCPAMTVRELIDAIDRESLDALTPPAE